MFVNTFFKKILLFFKNFLRIFLTPRRLSACSQNSPKTGQNFFKKVSEIFRNFEKSPLNPRHFAPFQKIYAQKKSLKRYSSPFYIYVVTIYSLKVFGKCHLSCKRHLLSQSLHCHMLHASLLLTAYWSLPRVDCCKLHQPNFQI